MGSTGFPLQLLRDILMNKLKVPNAKFQTREVGEWVENTSSDYFSGKRVVVVALPGAFTPTCSSKQLPGYEEKYNEFKERGIDEVYCLSVNDAFVMNAWAEKEHIVNVKMIPDGSGTFTRYMGMLVSKDDKGFGQRSWRYSMVVNNGVIEALFEEPGKSDNLTSDPYGESSPESMLKYLTN